MAEKGEAEERALDDYGRNLGIAFQLVDNAMDCDFRCARQMGKGKGDDFREGKMTLPVILAYAQGCTRKRAFWKDAMLGHRASDEDLAHAVELIARHDAVTATRERAQHFATRDQRASDVPGQRGQGGDGRGSRICRGAAVLGRAFSTQSASINPKG